MAYNNQANPKKKNALDNRKLNLFAPTPGHPDRQATLMWNVFANNPRITVFTEDPADKTIDNGNGRISANLDTPTFYAFIEMLEKVAKSKSEIDLMIKNRNFVWINNVRSDDVTVVSELHAGKDAEGVVWISVQAKNRPIIKFYPSPSEWHQLCYADNTPLNKAETSTLYALGYCHLLRNMVSTILVDEYVEPVPRNETEYSKPPQPQKEYKAPPIENKTTSFADDDIPF